MNYTGYGLSEKVVVGMYEDQDNMIWLGTDGGGMNRLYPRTGAFLLMILFNDG